MEKRSKTTMEIFEEKYPVEELEDNPVLIAEAIGYLKATKEYTPSLEKEIQTRMTLLMLLITQCLI